MPRTSKRKSARVSDSLAEEHGLETFGGMEIGRGGTKIILPNQPRDMTYDEGIEALQMFKRAEEEDHTVHHEIDCFPLDGAVAFIRALTQVYGNIKPCKTPPKSFMDGWTPPRMVTVQTGPGKNEKIQIPWGSIQVPNIEGRFETSMKGGSTPKFIITGVVKKKHEEEVQQIANLTEKIVQEQSIYKGKAVRLGFRWLHEDRPFDPLDDAPKFIDVSEYTEGDLIYNQETQDVIRLAVYTPIEQADRCRRHQIPIKRGILLEGPYGTGKTMTAYVTAGKCVSAGFTFLYLEDAKDLAKALHYAKRYAPCCIFAEDIDTAMGGNVNELQNTIDGVDFKDKEIITVLTTNHIEKIDQALLRPGRLDAVIHVGRPNSDAAQRLVVHYARELLRDGEDLTEVGELLAGNTPAVIREVVERSKLSALTRVGDDEIEGNMTAHDIAVTARAMQHHFDLLKDKGEQPERPLDQLFENIAARFMEIGSCGREVNPEIRPLIRVAAKEALRSSLSEGMDHEAVEGRLDGVLDEMFGDRQVVATQTA